MGAVVAFVSRKGGVGKTSLLWHLAGLWSVEGLRVRVVDMDSQASLSQVCLGAEAVDGLRPSDSVEAILTGSAKAEAVERPTRWNRITLIPSHLGLRPSASSVRAELRSDEADLTLIDTPPDTTSPLVRAALLASDFVVSPVDPEAFGAASVLSVQGLCYSVAVAHNPQLCLLGFVVNRRGRLAVHGVVEDALRRLHGEQIFHAAIPDLVTFKEAALAREPLSYYAPRSKAAAIVRGLGEEVLERIARAAERRAA